MPAFTSSSLYFPILERSSLLGRTPASEFLSALTITMTLIVLSPVCFLPGPGLSDGTDRPNPASIWTSNERHPDRQVEYAFWGYLWVWQFRPFRLKVVCDQVGS